MPKFLRQLLFLGCLSLQVGAAVAQQDPAAELELRFRQLDMLGPDASADREGAVEYLLQRLDLPAHEKLQAKLRLRKEDDPDKLRECILTSLARRLLPNSKDRVFGGLDENKDATSAIVRSYVPALAWFWRGDLEQPDPLRELARTCIVRMPVRELEAGLAAMLEPTQPLEQRLLALRTAADSQNLYLARLLADFIGDPVDQVRATARASLQLLTFVDGGFATRKEVEDWLQQLGSRRYLDLAEAAARNARAAAAGWRREMEQKLRQKSADLVAALVSRPTSIDWGKVSQEVLNGPPGTTDACLDRLLQLPDFLDNREPPSPARQAFHKALLERFTGTSTATPSDLRRRALLLETLALLARGDSELGPEIQKQLLAALSAEAKELRLAALRGLRHFPKPEARAAVVAFAGRELEHGAPADLDCLRAALNTLGKRPHTAPAEGDGDRAAWLQLLRQAFLLPGLAELRGDALAMGALRDANDQLLPQVFDVLVELGTNTALPADSRKLCLIKLGDFAPQRAPKMVQELVDLLDDPDPAIRGFAASELGHLPDANDQQKRAWIEQVLNVVRSRLTVENERMVFHALVVTAGTYSAPPGTPSSVITCLCAAVDELPSPLPDEQKWKLELLLQNLQVQATQAAAPVAAWASAGQRLLRHSLRPALRRVLEQQRPLQLVNDLQSQDATKADSARMALLLLPQAALLKPAADAWDAGEAADVRTAFFALENDGKSRTELGAPKMKILRLQALVGCGAQVSKAYDEAARLAEGYLADNGGADGKPLDAGQKDQVRMLAAEAYLGLSPPKKEQAHELLQKCDPASFQRPGARDLIDRLGRAFAESPANGDTARAVRWLALALQLTSKDDRAVYRTRVLAWASTEMKANPANVDEVKNRLLQDETLFQAPDCPPEQRERFENLRGTN